MIIRARKDLFGAEDHGLLEHYIEGDKFAFRHAQNIEPILALCSDSRKEIDVRSFNKNEWEKVATVPAIEYVKHPEWNYDANALKKWLRSEEGKQYRTSRRAI